MGYIGFLWEYGGGSLRWILQEGGGFEFKVQLASQNPLSEQDSFSSGVRTLQSPKGPRTQIIGL